MLSTSTIPPAYGGGLNVSIDIKPNSINPASNGIIPVVVFGDAFVNSGGSIIEGNLQARGAERVDLGDCTIDGNVSILNSNTVTMESTSIGGKLTLRGNNSISLEDVTVTGLATCARNTNQDASDPNMYDGGNNGCPQPVD